MKASACFVLLFYCSGAIAQSLLLKEWDYRYGGSGAERTTLMIPTSDNGCLLGGYSISDSSGDKTQNSKGNYDFWIVKLDQFGSKQWDKDYGGVNGEYLFAAKQTKDGGYILAGSTQSIVSGDVSQPGRGGTDFWIVKTNAQGVLLWDKRYGGAGNDVARSVYQTSDGGYIVGGYTLSDSTGDMTQPSRGSNDYWIVRTDSAGNKLWDKRFGGINDDFLYGVQQTADGGYALAGYTLSDSGGDKTQHVRGMEDYWMVKTDAAGNKLWDKRFGGSGQDLMYSMQQTADGGYVMGGRTNSPAGGDKTEAPWGGYDYWVVKTDTAGNKQWDKRYGGTINEDEYGNTFQTFDGGYMSAGSSYSNIGGDKSEKDSLGFEQTWIIKTDGTGARQWDKTIYTIGHEEIGYAAQSLDGCYLVANFSGANIGGYKTQFGRGGHDYWVVKFCVENVRSVHICQGDSFFTGGAMQTVSGTYIDTLTAVNGNDSVVKTSLTVHPPTVTYLNKYICLGDSVLLGGEYQTYPGVYYDTLKSQPYSCDSVLITNLFVVNVSDTVLNVTICYGKSYYAGGTNQTATGTYYDSIGLVNCSAFIRTNLTVLPYSGDTVHVNICGGENYFAGGGLRSTSGTYRDTLVNSNGCDSVLVTLLTVLPSPVQLYRSQYICFGDSFFAAGNYQKSPGFYHDTLTSIYGCDSVFLTTNLFVVNVSDTIINATICYGKSYYAGGANQTTTGTYYDTIGLVNCSAIITTHLTVLPKSTDTVQVYICSGEHYYIGGANRTTSGQYRDTLANVNGCDSIHVTNLTVRANYFQNYTVTICQGDSFFAGSAYQSETGIYNDNFINGNVCEHLTTNLVVENPHTVKDVNLCKGQSYYASGAWRTTAGAYFDTLSTIHGCDSFVVTNLSVYQPDTTILYPEICNGQFYLAGGWLRISSGTYYDTLSTVHGCDSLIIHHLTVHPRPSVTVNASICQGNSYYAGGMFRTTAGTYHDTLTTIYGCDSFLTTNLTVRNPSFASRTVNICNGQSFFAGGMFQTSAGTYYDTLTAMNGCDSFLTTQLNVLSNTYTTHNPAICEGESYFAGGTNRFTSGTYYDTLSAGSCHEFVTTNLTVLTRAYSGFSVSICDGDSYFAGGAYQTSSGVYHDTLAAVNGCDSVITTTLNVRNPLLTSVAKSICSGQSYFAGGANQTSSGVYSDTLTSVNGCDSVIVTNLTVSSFLSSNRNISICQGQSYFAGGANQSASGVYTDTLLASGNCDSVIYTHLTVLSLVSTYKTPVICQGDSYYAGGANQTSSGTYLDTLTAANSCDSIVHTNLTVLSPSASFVSTTICEGESYFAGGANQTVSGNYTDTLTAANTCDSVVHTNLTVLPRVSSSIAATICAGESYFTGGANRTVSGIYSDTLVAVNGCDSVVATHLNVLDTFITGVTISIYTGDSVFAAGAFQTIAGNYFDTLTAVTGCDSVIVTHLNVLPRTLTSSVTSVNTSCFGSADGSATVAAFNGVPPYRYLWSTGDTLPAITLLAAGIYYVTITDAINTSVVNSVTITSPGPQIVPISADTTIICANDSARLCAPSGYTAYHWNTGQTDTCIKTSLSGNYYLTVTDNINCTAESNHLAITVLPLPPVSISVNGDTLSVYNAVTQQWYLNGNIISGATGNVYIAHTGGSYAVEVSDTNGCTATSLPVIVSGLDNIMAEDMVNVFPNPSNNNWQLETGGNFIGGEAIVTDADGRVVFKSLIVNRSSSIGADIPRGVYQLRISSSKKSVVRKLIRL